MPIWDEIVAWQAQNELVLIWVGILSAFFFVASILSLPLLVSKIPVDYFVRPVKKLSLVDLRPINLLKLVLKNIVGGILLLMGFLMLFLPGQGLLTMFIGLVLLDFPGKFKLEQNLICNIKVYSAVDWLRKKGNSASLDKPNRCS